MNAPSISLPRKKSLVASLSPEATHVAVVCLVAIAVIAPTVFWGIPSSRDLSNHFRFALPFYDALRSGDFYPGWLAESNHGFGDASFRFYPPGLYYLMALARIITGNWYAATVITFVLVSAMGAVGMYLWAREFASSATAMWAGVFYSVAPYHINQLFQAFMLAEFAGAAILPFAFLFVERICRYRRVRDVGGLAAAYALLVLTHLPLAVIGSLALAFYAVLRIDKTRVWKTLGALGISVGIALAASACYWMTMLFELKWIRADNVNPEPGVNYRSNFVLSTFSPDFLNVWWMNILLLFSLAMFWPAVILATRAARELSANPRVQNSVTKHTVALIMLLSFALFMTTPLSRPIWNHVRPLQETQFPWRWLSIAGMASSLLLALSVPFWTRLAKTRKRPLAMLAAGTFAISLAFSVGHIIREARWLTPVQFEQTLVAIPGSASVYQWLPVWTREPLPQMNLPVEAADRSVEIVSWTPERRVFHVSAGNSTDARIRTFFYPHWTARTDDRQLAVHPDQNGAMIVALPKEPADITLEFREPKRAKYAAGLSLMGWVLIGALFLKPRRLAKR